MAEKNILTNEQKKRYTVEKMWLNFYNDSLLAKGMITEDQHRRMHVKISCRKAPTAK